MRSRTRLRPHSGDQDGGGTEADGSVGGDGVTRRRFHARISIAKIGEIGVNERLPGTTTVVPIFIIQPSPTQKMKALSVCSKKKKPIRKHVQSHLMDSLSCVFRPFSRNCVTDFICIEIEPVSGDWVCGYEAKCIGLLSYSVESKPDVAIKTGCQ